MEKYMQKKALYTLLLLLPALAMASGGEHEGSRYLAVAGRESDFIPRIFNFLVFSGLIYYLVATPIKDFFKGRQDGIANQLNEIESKLQEAKDAQKSAELAVVESENKAKEIIVDSNNEVELLAKKLIENNQNDLHLLEKQHEEKLEYDERKMIKDTINSVLNDNITSDDIPLSESQVVDIVSRKVA
jgi:F-type H+-transporting ATPase subunit b